MNNNPNRTGTTPLVWGPVHTVADMVRNLLTLDQATPLYTAFGIQFNDKRRYRTRPVMISRERVIDGRWVDSTREDAPYATIVWANQDERTAEPAMPKMMPSGVRDVISSLQDVASPEAIYEAIRTTLEARAQATLSNYDDLAVDHFAGAMKTKMAISQAKGRSGWDDPNQCTVESLQAMLLDHVAKGDPVDVANFCMMLWIRGGRTVDQNGGA